MDGNSFLFGDRISLSGGDFMTCFSFSPVVFEIGLTVTLSPAKRVLALFFVIEVRWSFFLSPLQDEFSPPLGYDGSPITVPEC